MDPSPTSRPAAQQLDDPRWQGLCNHIHITDDISFKLLALVPLVSIAGIATALMKDDPKPTPILALLSLFAASVTLALWLWERRNLQTCLWLRCRAADLEEHAFGGVPGQFFAFSVAPDQQGKTQAEQFVYGLTIAAWLLLPGAVLVSKWPEVAAAPPWRGAAAYALAAGGIGLYAWHALRVEIKLKPNFVPRCDEADPEPRSQAQGRSPG